MDINFYPGDKSKIIGLTMASPEEFQTYAAALVDVPEGCVLTTRVRKTKEGRREILVGAAEIGSALALEGEDVKPLPAPPVPKALTVPDPVHAANDADLETIAARNGVKVTEAWRRRNRNLREADVAAAMARAKETVGV